MALDGTSEATHGYNTKVKNGVLPDADMNKAILPPIGSVFSWVKTFVSVTSGTTDATTAGKLENSGDTFQADGVALSYLVLNTTDVTETWVTAVDSETVLSVNDDIFVSGENYNIYSTPYLPDGYVECNGQVLSDADSPFDGATIPDLNGNNNFLRGGSTSGGTGGNLTHNHSWAHPNGSSQSIASNANSVMNGSYDSAGSEINFTNASGSIGPDSVNKFTDKINNEPPFYDVVMIIRIK